MTTSRLRDISKQLLGRIYRLEIAAAIHDWPEETFTATQLADATGIRYARVHEDMSRLAEADMIVDSLSPGQSVAYQATSSVYWECCARLLSELESPHDLDAK